MCLIVAAVVKSMCLQARLWLPPLYSALNHIPPLLLSTCLPSFPLGCFFRIWTEAALYVLKDSGFPVKQNHGQFLFLLLFDCVTLIPETLGASAPVIIAPLLGKGAAKAPAHN